MLFLIGQRARRRETMRRKLDPGIFLQPAPPPPPLQLSYRLMGKVSSSDEKEYALAESANPFSLFVCPPNASKATTNLVPRPISFACYSSPLLKQLPPIAPIRPPNAIFPVSPPSLSDLNLFGIHLAWKSWSNWTLDWWWWWW